MHRRNLLHQALRQPESLFALNLAEWDLLLRQARHAILLAHLGAMLARHGLLERAPAQVREHFAWADVVAQRHRDAVRWEVEQIRKAEAKSSVGVPIILLKGAAYAMGKHGSRRWPPVFGHRHPGAKIQP